DAKLHKWLANSVEARMVVDAATNQIVETVRADRRPIAMYFEHERARAGLELHAICRGRLRAPKLTLRIAQGGVVRRQRKERYEQYCGAGLPARHASIRRGILPPRAPSEKCPDESGHDSPGGLRHI